MTGIPDRLASALADRYRLERELGQGEDRDLQGSITLSGCNMVV